VGLGGTGSRSTLEPLVLPGETSEAILRIHERGADTRAGEIDPKLADGTGTMQSIRSRSLLLLGALGLCLASGAWANNRTLLFYPRSVDYSSDPDVMFERFSSLMSGGGVPTMTTIGTRFGYPRQFQNDNEHYVSLQGGDLQVDGKTVRLYRHKSNAGQTIVQAVVVEGDEDDDVLEAWFLDKANDAGIPEDSGARSAAEDLSIHLIGEGYDEDERAWAVRYFLAGLPQDKKGSDEYADWTDAFEEALEDGDWGTGWTINDQRQGQMLAEEALRIVDELASDGSTGGGAFGQ